MARNRFINPVNNTVYEWPQNHLEEEENGVSRQVTETANSGSGTVAQQATDTPERLRYSLRIYRRSQLRALLLWWRLCETQTVYFYDFDDQGYEVQILSVRYQRVRNALRAGPDPGTHTWQTTVEMRIVRYLAGDAYAVGFR